MAGFPVLMFLLLINLHWFVHLYALDCWGVDVRSGVGMEGGQTVLAVGSPGVHWSLPRTLKCIPVLYVWALPSIVLFYYSIVSGCLYIVFYEAISCFGATV